MGGAREKKAHSYWIRSVVAAADLRTRKKIGGRTIILGHGGWLQEGGRKWPGRGGQIVSSRRG